MITIGKRQVFEPVGDAQRTGRGRLAVAAFAGKRTTLFRSRTCVAILAAFLLLQAGRASTENAVSGYGDCATASVGGGGASADAGLHGIPFNAVFGLNSMARGETASPSPFR